MWRTGFMLYLKMMSYCGYRRRKPALQLLRPETGMVEVDGFDFDHGDPCSSKV